MCGGRVPGARPSAASRLTLRTISGHLPGGPWGVNLTDLATSYWFNDCWLLDPKGGSAPERLRLLDPSRDRSFRGVGNGTAVWVMAGNTGACALRPPPRFVHSRSTSTAST